MELKKRLDAQQVLLVAVSKTQPIERISSLYEEGIRDFGENKAQELCSKHEALPKDIRWHFIGHLQKNKVKYIAPFVHLIHSVDSWELLQEISKQALKYHRTIDVLLQFHIAEEETKFGMEKEEALELLNQPPLPGVRICGVMGMASFSENTKQVKSEFEQLNTLFYQLKEAYFPNAPWFTIRSMGMSGDWELAVECGSNLVRIGSLLFGERTNKTK